MFKLIYTRYLLVIVVLSMSLTPTTQVGVAGQNDPMLAPSSKRASHGLDVYTDKSWYWLNNELVNITIRYAHYLPLTAHFPHLNTGYIEPNITHFHLIRCEIYHSNGTLIDREEWKTDGDIRQTKLWRPTDAGVYRINASSWWNGTEKEVDTYTVISVIEKGTSSIRCLASTLAINRGETVSISGSITPAYGGVIVILTYGKPDGTTFNRTLATSSAGTFKDSYVPDSIGRWTMYASWGNLVSSSVSFAVEEKRQLEENPLVRVELLAFTVILGMCIIASAYMLRRKITG